MLAAIYARHSTDKLQGSTEDQIARSMQHCRRLGYTVVEIFCDRATSGATMMNRAGIKHLIRKTLKGRFERLIAEDLSRLSRDQGDIATFFKRLSFADIVLETVAEGVIGELHIGLKGSMNALYLKDLADKTRRGQIASVQRGAVPGGQVYGYDIVRRFDEAGEPIRGARAINQEQAEVVRQIFTAFADGTSLKRICQDLNALGVPSPAGGKWGVTTLVGSASRATGILRQTLYKGVVTFNRMHFKKHPETGKRLSVPRPPEDWVQAPVPDLAIVDADLFDQVQTLIDQRSSARKEVVEQRKIEDAEAKAARAAAKQRKWRLEQQERPRKLTLPVFSGRLHCTEHDVKIRTQHWRHYACPEKGCANRGLKWDELMPLCIDALGQLTTDDMMAHFTSSGPVAERASHDAAIADLARRIEERRASVRAILTTLGPQARTENVRQVLEEQEQEIRRLTYEQARHQRQRDALQPSPAAVDAALARFRAMLTQLRLAPEDHRLTVPLKACVQRFEVTTVEDAEARKGRRRMVRAVFNVPKVMELEG
ncbi:recombinase family protein [Caenispirillum bisanense]|uniref:recombinase family protein n=1 Tax=Caenispirillum bisanense TaxID=414052 RepID=UPI0031D0B50E